ncbi:hypothetical protein Droror1_Dr00000565 [Drosera rotundifolia]
MLRARGWERRRKRRERETSCFRLQFLHLFLGGEGGGGYGWGWEKRRKLRGRESWAVREVATAAVERSRRGRRRKYREGDGWVKEEWEREMAWVGSLLRKEDSQSAILAIG